MMAANSLAHDQRFACQQNCSGPRLYLVTKPNSELFCELVGVLQQTGWGLKAGFVSWAQDDIDNVRCASDAHSDHSVGLHGRIVTCLFYMVRTLAVVHFFDIQSQQIGHVLTYLRGAFGN